ncbi:Ctage Family Member 4, partial [Manis pentadactyla]
MAQAVLCVLTAIQTDGGSPVTTPPAWLGQVPGRGEGEAQTRGRDSGGTGGSGGVRKAKTGVGRLLRAPEPRGGGRTSSRKRGRSGPAPLGSPFRRRLPVLRVRVRVLSLSRKQRRPELPPPPVLPLAGAVLPVAAAASPPELGAVGLPLSQPRSFLAAC